MAQRVWIEAGRDNLTVVSAGCAFCALFAIFPALSALPTAPATVENQLSMLPAVLADRSLRDRTLAESPNRTLGWSFVVSIGPELWSAMSLT